MPYTSSDADRFKKGLDKDQKKKWAIFANGAEESCLANGGTEQECFASAVRIANSKFPQEAFNSVLSKSDLSIVNERGITSPYRFAEEAGAPDAVCRIFRSGYEASDSDHSESKRYGWAAVHAAGWFKNKKDRWVRRSFAMANGTGQGTGQVDSVKRPQDTMDVVTKRKYDALVLACMNGGGNRAECEIRAKADVAKMTRVEFQNKKETPPDPRDGHVHQAAFDEDGNGGTSEAGSTPHVHSVFGFKVQPYYEYDEASGEDYVSVHPGSLAFADTDGSEIEMEIFRAGTHNKMEFDEADLETMASNFHALKDELRPKLKITHREGQEKLAGLSSYGDVTDVYTRPGADGKKRLFAKVANVPNQVREWIRDRRFPERSIELYPEFKLGTEENSPTYKNVLKAIALLGAEMPAVTGMAPIVLEECIECQGTVCVRTFTQKDLSASSGQVPDELRLSFETLEKTVGLI